MTKLLVGIAAAALWLVSPGAQAQTPPQQEVAPTPSVKLTLEQRYEKLRDSRIGTQYIDAAFDLMCDDAEKRGFNLRGSPEVLGQMYHSRTPANGLSLARHQLH